MTRVAPIEATITQVARDSTALNDCVKRTLHRLAEILQAPLLLKEASDDLHADFPPGTIVGSLPSWQGIDAARPIIAKVRYMPEHRSWQFSIHDQAIYDLYEIEMEGKPLVAEEVFAQAVRDFFACPEGGWRAVSPMSSMTKADGRRVQ